MTVEHPSGGLVGRYARGDADIPADEVWAVEAHLEKCAPCRALLADTDDGVLVDAVWTDLRPLLDAVPQMPRRRPWLRGLNAWVTPSMVPWLTMTLVVALLAVLADRLSSGGPDGVSVVLLVAPVLPVLGVAAAWGRGLDPVYEMTASTPRAGLPLLLRRTVSVLLTVIPILLAAGPSTSTALWLLPCLAFTTTTLALGGLVGIGRAAIALVVVWAVVIVAPSTALIPSPLTSHQGGLPVWGVLLALGLVVVAVRKDAYTHLGAHR
ncbi:zf-HC2 domain-containing protein [Umezawaea sp. Da 62-37]|uniref:zf-HC2 domain-containing protein n=1 Tax=Umezawaea sp. Da 62-37 TaxID=3075927 RepID=UPI0028F74711|nr:zf-HC2 domain-containing protein [Umezawaea sp. Da 62-37]WNV88403.1 zf-HC2 domain-containing protein [Umezawaea sp. Da 62-37]